MFTTCRAYLVLYFSNKKYEINKLIDWLYEQGREGYYEGKHTQSHLFIIFTNWKCSIINVPTNYMQSCLILRMIVQISVLQKSQNLMCEYKRILERLTENLPLY